MMIENPENFERNVLYHFDFNGDKLIIASFARLRLMFIMNGGNHRTDWFTNIHSQFSAQVGGGDEWPNKDTLIGNDV